MPELMVDASDDEDAASSFNVLYELPMQDGEKKQGLSFTKLGAQG